MCGELRQAAYQSTYQSMTTPFPLCFVVVLQLVGNSTEEIDNAELLPAFDKFLQRHRNHFPGCFVSADPTRLLDQPGIHIHPCHAGVVSSAFVSYTVLVQLQKVLGGDLLLPPRVDAAQACLLSSRVLRFSAPCPSGN